MDKPGAKIFSAGLRAACEVCVNPPLRLGYASTPLPRKRGARTGAHLGARHFPTPPAWGSGGRDAEGEGANAHMRLPCPKKGEERRCRLTRSAQ